MALPAAALLVLVWAGFYHGQNALSFAKFAWIKSEPQIISPVLLGAQVEPLFPIPQPSNEISLKHTVQRGETLGTVVQKYGLPWETADSIHKEFRNVEQGSEKISVMLRIGQELRLNLDEEGRLRRLSTSLDATRRVVAEVGADGAVDVAVHELPNYSVERMAVGQIEASFAAAASRAGVPYDLVDELVDLFSSRVSFHRDFRKGDRFSLIYTDNVLPDGSSLKPGPILAAALQIGGNIMVAVRYVGSDGKARYFDEKGELIGNTFLRYPVKFSRISSYFSKSRFHPVLKRPRPHNGVDFAAPIGTPVRTVADGKVLFAGRKGGNGLMVKIQHNDRYSTAYVHLSKIAPRLRKGSKVTRGEVIGNVGMTGLATGPHLHYALYDRGKYVDPLKAKLPTTEVLSRGTRISPTYLKRVLFTLHHYQTIEIKNFYWG